MRRSAERNNATLSLMTLYTILQRHERLQVSRNRIGTEWFCYVPNDYFQQTIYLNLLKYFHSYNQFNQASIKSHQTLIGNSTSQNESQTQSHIQHNVFLLKEPTSLIYLRAIHTQHPNSTQSLLHQLLVQTPLLQLQDHPPLAIALTILPRKPISRNPQSLPPRRFLRQPDPRLRFQIDIASGASIARRPPWV